MVSVLILTLNEEMNLPTCLASVQWSDDIVVLDSFSSDRTVAIAREAGARVYQRHFDNEINQRMYGIQQVPFKYDWIYAPDADEVTTPELASEICRKISDPTRNEVAYRVRWQNMFMGQWLRHCGLYPVWVARLYRKDKVILEREVHPRYLFNGPEGKLDAHLLHYSFNNGLHAWFDKHNRYSTGEARESIKSRHARTLDWAGLFRRHDPVRSRAALKELTSYLPCRPTLRFIYMYLFRLGILDGRVGFTYCRLLALYEYLIVMKITESRRREKGLPM